MSTLNVEPDFSLEDGPRRMLLCPRFLLTRLTPEAIAQLCAVAVYVQERSPKLGEWLACILVEEAARRRHDADPILRPIGPAEVFLDVEDWTNEDCARALFAATTSSYNPELTNVEAGTFIDRMVQLLVDLACYRLCESAFLPPVPVIPPVPLDSLKPLV